MYTKTLVLGFIMFPVNWLTMSCLPVVFGLMHNVTLGCIHQLSHELQPTRCFIYTMTGDWQSQPVKYTCIIHPHESFKMVPHHLMFFFQKWSPQMSVHSLTNVFYYILHCLYGLTAITIDFA